MFSQKAFRNASALWPALAVLALSALLVAAGCAQRNTAQANPSPAQKKKMIGKLQSLTPADGYLQSHKGNRNPPDLLGGPIRVTLRQQSGGVFVGLPAHRELDPTVFGPADMPREYGGTPGITGVPPAFRKPHGNGGRQTGPLTPFGDKHVVLPNGRLQISATDRTAVDAATTEDRVRMKATWQDKGGNTYEVRCCGKMAAHGLEFPTFGGVMTNGLLHGWTGLGTPLMPTEYTYFAFWGFGEVRKNGEVLDKPRLVHGMLTEYVRTAGYELGFDEDVEPNRRHFHLMVAPFKPVPAQHKFKHVNVNTGFKLPNGKTLPFWHVMFESLEVNASRG